MSETTYEPTGEVRIALVLYGGVSLAIYMNGVVQELLALVRSTAPALDTNGQPTTKPLMADGELRGAEPAYRELGKQLDRGNLTADASQAIRSRMVVDLLTGTSAGGINGIFLAKALAEQCPIDALTELWIEHGDIGRLLNDRNAADGIPGMTAPTAPESLLSGERMLYELLAAMTKVSAAGSKQPGQRTPYVDTLDLWVTATDLRGRSEEIDLDDTGPRPYELGHRKTFHFRYDTGLEDATVTVAENDFTRDHDPMLAFAARCTSSFPGAFPPARLVDVARAVEEVNANARPSISWDPASDLVKPFFAEYGREPDRYDRVCFADGGYLDNHPVDLIMSTLPRRRASLPVSRRVLLIDPDPSSVAAPGIPPAEPVDLLSTVAKVLTLPRADEISDDVARIRALSEPAQARADIYQRITEAIGAGATTPASDPLDAIAYDELRILLLQKDLATGLARVVFDAREYGPDSPWAVRLLEMLGAWRRALPPISNNPDTTLRHLDVSLTLRRINFLQGRIDVLMRQPGTPPAELRALRTTCARTSQTLASEARALLRRDGNPFSAKLDDLAATLRGSASGGISRELLVPLDAVLVEMADHLAAASSAAEQTCQTSLSALTGAGSAGTDAADLLTAWQNFAAYDQATFALSQLLPGENRDLEVHRISPRDETSLFDEVALKRKKLAGANLHHFGAFLEADWRRNDILWGRLDAAEGIIKAVYPANDSRAMLVQTAQHGIVLDALGDAGYRNLLVRLVLPGEPPATDDTMLATQVLEGYRKNYAPPPPPDRPEAVRLTSRSLRVIERIGETMARNATGAGDTISTWVGRLLKLSATTLDLALPTTTVGYYGAHLIQLVVLAAGIMVVLGSLSSHAGVVGFGWEVIAAGVGLLLAASTVRAWIYRRRHPWWAAPAGVVVIGFVACAVVFTHDWVRLLVVSLIGLAVGLVLGAVGGRKHTKVTAGKTQPLDVAAVAIAVLAIIGVAAGGVAAAREHSRHHLCTAGAAWWKHPARNVLALTCPPATPAA